MAKLTINGEAHNIDIDPDTPLLWAIREWVGLTGTKGNRAPNPTSAIGSSQRSIGAASTSAPAPMPQPSANFAASWAQDRMASAPRMNCTTARRLRPPRHRPIASGTSAIAWKSLPRL